MKKQKIIFWPPPLGLWVCGFYLCPSLSLSIGLSVSFSLDQGQIGRHTPEHAKAVAVANVLPRLLHLYARTDLSEDLQTKAKKALKNILQKCVYLPVLEPLLHEASPNILKHVVAQFSKVLPHDPKARRLFVTSGGLKKVWSRLSFLWTREGH
jgi:hypothetical protein